MSYSDQLKRIEAELAKTNELLREQREQQRAQQEQQRVAALSPEQRALEEEFQRETEERRQRDQEKLAERVAALQRKRGKDWIPPGKLFAFSFFAALVALISAASGHTDLAKLLGFAAFIAFFFAW